MKKLIKYFSIFEWCLYLISIVVIVMCFIIFKNDNYFYLIGSIVGVTALIFLSKGHVLGQIITIIFSVFYGVVSLSFKYYGEMITYMFMTMPIAIISIITWLKHPSKQKKNEVEVNELKWKEYILLAILSLVVTFAFYFILKAFNTNNLIISTISILTSFVAVYLSMRRSRYYAIAYACNDIVLIVLWILASIEQTNYISMVICFVAFLASDIYAFINWGRILKQQKKDITLVK